jgi:hypothetical protein
MTQRPASRRPLRISFSILTISLLACAVSATAQTVRGRLTAREGGAPVAGALVALVDAEGREVRTAVSDRDGRYRIDAPGAGQYAVRVERVGRESVTSARFPLAQGEERDLPLALAAEAITLEAVRAEAGRRCTPRPGRQDGLALQRVWDEARKALRSTMHAAADSGGAAEFVTFERTYTPNERQLVDEKTERHRGRVGRPFASITVEELAEHGFVRALDGVMTFYGPDAEVLLSDLFLERHCFHLREGTGDEAGMIGLAFEPVRGRRRPDVTGVLWLDRRTAELRHLAFGYAGVHPADDAPAEGRVDFARTPAGAWIVRSWILRFPVADLRLTRDLPTNYRLAPAKALKEVGGEVTRMDADGGSK